MTTIKYVRDATMITLTKIINAYRECQQSGNIPNNSPLRKIAKDCGYSAGSFLLMYPVIYTEALSEAYNRLQPSCTGCKWDIPPHAESYPRECKSCSRYWPDLYRQPESDAH